MSTFHEGFSMLRLSYAQPFLTLTERLLTFSKSSIELLNYAPYVHISINREKKQFLVESCEPDRYSIPFVKLPIKYNRAMEHGIGEAELTKT